MLGSLGHAGRRPTSPTCSPAQCHLWAREEIATISAPTLTDAGRDWGQEEKGTTEDEMAGWHHRLGGHESEWTPGDGDGQGGLACYNSWGYKELDMTERLNWTDLTEDKGYPAKKT